MKNLIDIVEFVFSVFPFGWGARVGTSFHWKDGSLFYVPTSEIEETKRIRHFDGWSQSKIGYACYSVSIENIQLVFPGLKVQGYSSHHGKSAGKTILLEPEEFQNLVHAHIEKIKNVISERNLIIGNAEQISIEMMDNLLHEIRPFNRNINNLVDRLIKEKSDSELVEEIAEDIKTFSFLLSTRCDIETLVATPDKYEKSRYALPVRKLFDRFKFATVNQASESRARIHTRGSSYSTINALPIFNAAAYILIDNAVKHSIPANDIYLDFSEDVSKIFINITNIGREILPDEVDSIWQYRVRGKNAEKSNIPGQGIGLHYLKEIVENQHGGRVTLSQKQISTRYEGECCFETTVKLELPIFAKRDAPATKALFSPGDI